MTIKEAEWQYHLAVEQCKSEHTKRAKKSLIIWNIIAAAFLVIGVILVIVGFTASPQEVFYDGTRIYSLTVTLERAFGVAEMVIGAFIMILMNVVLCRAIKTRQIDLLPCINDLYLNYVKCEDMSGDDKEFYKQKLEDIRNEKLVNAIHDASAAMSSVVLFSMLCK